MNKAIAQVKVDYYDTFAWKERVQKAAQAAGLSRSSYLRQIVRAEVVKDEQAQQLEVE